MTRQRDPAVETLDQALKRRAIEGVLYEKLYENKLRCFACGHRCVIPEGFDGICKIRFNRGGKLLVPSGYVAGLQVDPIEKKPFYHAFPGAAALSFGMLGCDYHCGYCQNWLSSQALRDSAARSPTQDIGAEQILALAKRHAVPVMVSTYNEPLITTEWAVEIFSAARREGIICGYVSNGNATPEVLRYLRPYVDLFKVDLKGFRQENYRELGGRLENVIETIRLLHEMGFWVEVVTLLVPGFNDSPDELRDMATFLASVSPDIPWHVTAFHQNYKMIDKANTTTRDLSRAAGIGKEAGLRYVYAGNLPGHVGDLENTRCPGCDELLIERFGFKVLQFGLRDDGTCPSCGTPIAGFWGEDWSLPENNDGIAGRRSRPITVRPESVLDPARHGKIPRS
jgi:pyruvate formate lyase activating enzyme